MKKASRIVVTCCTVALAATLAGCASGEQPKASSSASSSSSVSSSAQQQATSPSKDFDGSAYTDTGAGVMYLSTSAGTTENGNVPELVYKQDAALVQIGINTEGMDGSACTVYVDGIENTKLNAGEMSQSSISLTGDALSEGVHTVELVRMDGEEPVIYKIASYKMVK